MSDAKSQCARLPPFLYSYKGPAYSDRTRYCEATLVCSIDMPDPCTNTSSGGDQHVFAKRVITSTIYYAM